MTNASSNRIENVSDTAFWVCTYRARESLRKDALFKDPYAALLSQDKGKEIADTISGSHFVDWTVIIRTCVIDRLILTAISEGIDTIINLGAGLDARPYRLNLPSSLRWIEVDYPHILDFKEKKLNDQAPNCKLERVPLDLADEKARRIFFSLIDSQNRKVLILTEGVIPYLSEAQVGSLATDLRSQPTFSRWITEYHSPEMYRHLRGKKKNKEMAGAPFQFFPEKWLPFFNSRSWQEKETIYLVEETEKLRRPFPLPLWGRILHSVIPRKEVEKFRKMSGYLVLEPEDS